MIIKILGTGCPKCKKLEENAKEAVRQTGILAEVQKVSNINDIMKYDIALTPALVVDEKVKSSGKVLSIERIKNIIAVE